MKHLVHASGTFRTLPDRIVFDVDPGPDVEPRQVIAAAKLIRLMLNDLRLKSFVKTTGGTGLHVVLPILPQPDWKECLEFSRTLAAAASQSMPGPRRG